ncbi:MAG: Vitamin B12 import ATP-binding protein BtuD [Chlamydiae bacterium]|nr:Vitamin B12 import ATP-binding protein BtuD [Chlamydiota bacterium]
MPLKVQIARQDDSCPFKNDKIEFELGEGECLWLRGASGSGKTSIANDLAKLSPLRGATTTVNWSEKLDPKVRPVGILFQQGVLIDSLNLKENLVLSCRSAGKADDKNAISDLLKSVNLDDDDRLKMPNELSGGMLRRAALAMILAQEKKLIILDEPFVGLDVETAEEVIKAIKALKERGVSFILVSHQEDFSRSVMTENKEVELQTRDKTQKLTAHSRSPRTSLLVRTLVKVVDYLGISIPLIFCAFIAAGFATSMLFAQMLKETDINTIMEQFHSDHTSLLFKIFGNEFAKVASKYLPIIKDKIYVMTMARGFVVELGPLLTALLLAGRIGGSYAGEVGMMQATEQNKLLTTLGLNPRTWTLLPSAIAAFIAAPILTAIGTFTGLLAGGWVAVWDKYGFFPSMQPYWKGIDSNVFYQVSWISYPPFVNFYRSMGYMVIILVVAEIFGRIKKNMQPRDVPRCITWAVVFSSLLIILCDWLFSQIYHSS